MSSSSSCLCELCLFEEQDTGCESCEHRICYNCCRRCDICSGNICNVCDDENLEELKCNRCNERNCIHGHAVGFSYRCWCKGKLVPIKKKAPKNTTDACLQR